MKSSSPAKRGPKPKADTRGNLVQAGLRIFHGEGYAATGIQSIVESVAVPKGSFYNHFASKEAFGAEVIDAYFERGQDKLRAFLCDSEAAPLDRLRAYFDDRIAAFRAAGFVKGCLLGNLSAEVADHSTLLREHLVVQFGAWSGFFEVLYRRGPGAGGRQPPIPRRFVGAISLEQLGGAPCCACGPNGATPRCWNSRRSCSVNCSPKGGRPGRRSLRGGDGR